MSNDSFQPVEHDAVKDADAIIEQARTAAREQAETAKATATKLLQAAAGDSTVLLTEAEQAAVTTVMSKVPEPIRAEVTAFGQGILNSALASVNATASATVTKGLAYAEALLAHEVNAFESAVGT